MHVRIPSHCTAGAQFVGEVGIVLLGVLIALAAEQIAENIHQQYRGYWALLLLDRLQAPCIAECKSSLLG